VSLDPLRRWEQHFGALPVPSPLVWAVLAATFLGFGVLLGRATPESPSELAARRTPLKLLVASAPATSTTSTATTVATPPPAETETTPEPSSTPAESPTPAPASKTSPSSGSSSGSKEASGDGKGSSPQSPKATLPAIRHVFVVMLSDQPYATVFGPASPAHYLTSTLEKKGELLERYYAVAHEGLADGIVLLSGQGPTEATAANCPTYTAIAPASAGAEGQIIGKGCVYPASTQTLMGQLTVKHLTWKAYIEGIDEGSGTPGACAHPASGAPDPSAAQAAGQNYQTWRNPIVYFESIVSSPVCASDDVGMDALKEDLASERRTASFSYIAPGPCDDGNPTPCAPGKQAGMVAANGFLQRVVPEILSSKAYKQDGLLAITVDQAPSTGEYADSSSCCGQPRFPNLPAPTGPAALSPAGGGQVGLLLLSPLVKGGGLVQNTYNHFSLLRSIENVFHLTNLGYAASAGVPSFNSQL
jgi:hypothetical protein